MLYDVVSVSVRVTPRSSRPGIERRGDEVLVRVAAPAADGRANEAARRAIAGRLGVPVSGVRIRSGHRSRVKIVVIEELSREEVMDRIDTGDA
jgi:uncharacterized protein (TIGR00251 family)